MRIAYSPESSTSLPNRPLLLLLELDTLLLLGHPGRPYEHPDRLPLQLPTQRLVQAVVEVVTVVLTAAFSTEAEVLAVAGSLLLRLPLHHKLLWCLVLSVGHMDVDKQQVYIHV